MYSVGGIVKLHELIVWTLPKPSSPELHNRADSQALPHTPASPAKGSARFPSIRTRMQRGTPFKPGNKSGHGRPKGSKNRATLEREALFEEFGSAITKKCISEALKGNNSALRLCMERIMPPATPSNPVFKLPPIRSAADLLLASASVLKAMDAGDLSPQEGESFMRVIESYQKQYESHELMLRVQALEQRTTHAVTTNVGPEPGRAVEMLASNGEESSDAK